MFESLQDNLSSALKTMAGKAKLTEGNMRKGLAEVEKALLEADVSYEVVQDFIARVSEQALGEQVLKSLNPSQQVVSIVHQELVNLMGPVDSSLHLKKGVSVLMLCGLQGSGKTTTCAKLARRIERSGKKVLMVAADLQRPAAIEQLHQLGKQTGIDVYSEPGQQNPVKVCNNAVRKAKELGAEVILLDTAGRLHIDDELMKELSQIDRQVEPQQVLLVVDGMTGQDAVNSAKAFNEALELDGVVMTKLDGDARGGATLSVKHVTGVPIKFMGTGEHIDDLEEFNAEGMAQRILGMGDMLALIQQAQHKLDQDELKKQQEKLAQGKFDLESFRDMMKQTTNMGSIGKLMQYLPGGKQLREMMSGVDADGEMKKLFGMIDSMTKAERRDPKLIDLSRRRRIAAGSGVEPHEVNELIKQFNTMKPMMEGMAGKSAIGQMREIQKMMKDGSMMDPSRGLQREKKGTGKRLSSQEKKQNKRQLEKERAARRKELLKKKRR